MAQTVIKLSQNKIDELKKTYQSNLLESTPPHAQFAAKVNGCTVTAYNSGKVMFQNGDHETLASQWGKPAAKKQAKERPKANLPSFLSSAHIGSDEAGTGDYFGPITVAAVFATPKQQELLKELGVRDSKTLSDETIVRVIKDVLHTDIVYSSVVLDNTRYNELKMQGWSQNKMKAWMHHHAIKHVKSKLHNTHYEGVLIDQFNEPTAFNRAVKETGEAPFQDLTFLTKAESYSIPVAAASMIARYRFLSVMDELSEQAGFKLQKGASNLVDQQIARLIRLKGEGFLNGVAKTHFANTKKARQYL